MEVIPLPPVLEIETRATCNRTCTGCLRNSHPDRSAVRDWFRPSELPVETFIAILREARDELGFRGAVCLSHYNEPLQDPRLPALIRHVRDHAFASAVFLHTNGDFLTESLAAELDGQLDWITVALYMAEPVKSRRQEWIASLFSRTRVHFTGGAFIATHFSPDFPVDALATAHRAHPCSEPGRRLIINHRGQMLFCCDDLIGHFDLGTYPAQSLSQLWYGERHQTLVRRLLEPGGRSAHSHCLTCPRA